MTKYATAILCVIMAATIYAATSLADERITFAHGGDPMSPIAQFADFLQHDIEQRGLSVDMAVRQGSEFRNMEEMQLTLRSGSAQFAAIPFSELGEKLPDFNVLSIPFAFNSADQVDAYLRSEAGEVLRDQIRDEGLVALAFLNSGMVEFGSDGVMSPVPWDANGNFLPGQAAKEVTTGRRIPEETKTAIKTNHRAKVYAVLASEEWFFGLPEEMQEQVLESVNSSLVATNNLVSAQDQEWWEFVQKNGIKVQTLSDDERAAWVSEARPSWDEFINQFSTRALIPGSNMQCAEGTCACLGTNACSKSCCSSD